MDRTARRRLVPLPLIASVIAAIPLCRPPAAFSQDTGPVARPAAEWSRAIQQATNDVRAGLRSEKPSEVAWAAFRAAEYRLFAVVPDLVERLTAPPAAGGEDRFALRAALIDSAVQLDAASPARVLRFYWDDFPVQSSILFAKATGQRDDVLLDLLSSSRDLRWFAVANLLLQFRSAGFIVAVLRPLHLQLDVTVSGGGGSGSGGGSVAVGDGIGQNPSGYPPRASYRFEIGSSSGQVVLSTGPRTIYYSRSVSYNWQFGISELSIGGPSAADRLMYVSAFARDSSDIARQVGERHESVPWQGADTTYGAV